MLRLRDDIEALFGKLGTCFLSFYGAFPSYSVHREEGRVRKQLEGHFGPLPSQRVTDLWVFFVHRSPETFFIVCTDQPSFAVTVSFRQ